MRFGKHGKRITGMRSGTIEPLLLSWPNLTTPKTKMGCREKKFSVAWLNGHRSGKGELDFMLIDQLKVVVVLIQIGVGSCWGSRAIGAASDDKGQPKSGQVAGKTSIPAPSTQANSATTTYRFTGTVKVEGTGEPIAGAKLRIALGDAPQPNMRVIAEPDDRGLVRLTLPSDGRKIALSVTESSPFSAELFFGLAHDEPGVGGRFSPRGA